MLQDMFHGNEILMRTRVTRPDSGVTVMAPDRRPSQENVSHSLRCGPSPSLGVDQSRAEAASGLLPNAAYARRPGSWAQAAGPGGALLALRLRRLAWRWSGLDRVQADRQPHKS